MKRKIKGLGDVIHEVMKSLGIKECAGCKKRRALLNKIIPLKKRRKYGTA
ncbi:unnamed protein product [marine sediment metagenome]|uniref:Uncharacterized protein n=1 Tax=marine sediment metagenome TaxID=412755 RepID=X1H6G0_9ZZZZ